MAALPAAIGRYLPQGVLGTGAMGVVYRAHDPLLDRPVAVKVMRTAGLEEELRVEYLARFRVEARAAGRCYHPAIVLVHDFGEEVEGPYLVMELVEGPTLAALLRRGPDQVRPWDAATLAGLLPSVLDGLASAHGFGIVHRDIKPSNLMVAQGSDQAKIADFGVARLPLGTLTAVGGMVGTPSYMAPEQALGEVVDHRADLFGTAAILHEILLGRPPFAGNGLADTLRRLCGPEPAELGTLDGSPLQAVLRRGLAKDPAARFADAAEFASALRAALAAPAAIPPPAEEGATVVMPAAAMAAASDAQFLDRLTEDLRATLGPVAVTLVRRTAAALGPGAGDALVRQLAQALEHPDDRRAFLRRHRLEPTVATVSSPTFGSPTFGSPAAGSSAVPAPEAGWSAPALAAAEAALAFHTGPIARVMVRRAAAEARSVDALITRLESQLPEPGSAPGFRRKLKAALDALPRPRG